MKDLNPNAGLRLGRYFTPVFGLAVESNVYFSNKPWESVGTVARAINTSLLGTVNLSNWFGGYTGEPRVFEISGIYGLGLSLIHISLIPMEWAIWAAVSGDMSPILLLPSVSKITTLLLALEPLRRDTALAKPLSLIHILIFGLIL